MLIALMVSSAIWLAMVLTTVLLVAGCVAPGSQTVAGGSSNLKLCQGGAPLNTASNLFLSGINWKDSSGPRSTLYILVTEQSYGPVWNDGGDVMYDSSAKGHFYSWVADSPAKILEIDVTDPTTNVTIVERTLYPAGTPTTGGTAIDATGASVTSMAATYQQSTGNVQLFIAFGYPVWTAI